MILEKTVIVNVGTQSYKHFNLLGYKPLFVGKPLEVKIQDLTKCSDVKVKCKCDICFKEYLEKWRVIQSPLCPNAGKLCRPHRVERGHRFKSEKYKKLSIKEKNKLKKRVSVALKKKYSLDPSSYKPHYKYDTESFIKISSKIHKGKFDYSKTKYSSSNKPVCINCPIHGEFWQNARRHMLGKGCVKCKQTSPGGFHQGFFNLHPEWKNKNAILYSVEMTHGKEKFYKIGITTKTLKERFRELPYKFKVLNIKEGKLFSLWKQEQKMIRQNFKNHYKPLQKFSGSYRECFKEFSK